MNDVIIGVDPSSKKLAMVATYVDLPGYQIGVFPLPKHDLGRNCYVAYRNMMRFIDKFGDSRIHLFIEEPFVSPKTVKAVLPLARINGVLHAAGVASKCETVQGVDIQRWKSKVVGKGNAGKPEVAKYMRDAWPVLYKEADGDQDVLDAAAINRYGHQVVDLASRIVSDQHQNQE